MSGDQIKHGISGYRRGCKCEICRTAKRDYMRQWRSRQRETAAAEAGEDHLADVEPEPEHAPLISAPTIDLKAAPGLIEGAFDSDMSGEAGDVIWRDSYVAMARMNARLMDQLHLHGRIDLVPSLQLRQLDLLNRLTYMKVDGTLRRGRKADESAGDAENGEPTLDGDEAERQRELDEISGYQ